MEPTPAVVTPNYASFARRIASHFIDVLILNILSFLLIMSFSIPMGLLAVTTNKTGAEGSLQQILVGLILVIIIFLIHYGYYIVFTIKRGQTPGKMALGIKVVKADNLSLPDFGTALMRELLGKFISGIILGIGYLFPLWDSRKQALHDKIANTVVIKI